MQVMAETKRIIDYSRSPIVMGYASSNLPAGFRLLDTTLFDDVFTLSTGPGAITESGQFNSAETELLGIRAIFL